MLSLFAAKNSIKLSHSLDALEHSNQPQMKLYNWNTISETLKSSFKYNLDPDTKTLIVAGDTDVLSNLLDELHNILSSKQIIESKSKTRGKNHSQKQQQYKQQVQPLLQQQSKNKVQIQSNSLVPPTDNNDNKNLAIGSSDSVQAKDPEMVEQDEDEDKKYKSKIRFSRGNRLQESTISFYSYILFHH